MRASRGRLLAATMKCRSPSFSAMEIIGWRSGIRGAWTEQFVSPNAGPSRLLSDVRLKELTRTKAFALSL